MKLDLSASRKYGFLSLALALALAFPPGGQAQEKLPAGAKIVRLEAFPPSLALKHAYDYRQLQLTALLDSGDRLDITRMVQLDQPTALVKISPGGLARPVADGKGEIKFAIAGQKLSIAVQVSGLKDKYQVSFVRDVMPVLSKVGCNAGTCHGAQQGKNGFKLSLRGYDPLFDHQALTDDLEGRRFNRAAPDRSLMLLKPSGGVPHVGGALFQSDSPYYQLLRLDRRRREA